MLALGRCDVPSKKTIRRRLPFFLAVVAFAIVAAGVVELTVLPIYVNVTKTRPISGEEYPAREHVTEAVVDQLDAHSGLLTALATVAIALFTLSLKEATDRLWDEAAIQRLETQRAADAAEIQAEWSGKQVEIARQQKDLLRYEYYAAHRPKLVVKDVYFNLDNDLSFEIANVGASSCVITDGWVALGHVSDERLFKVRDQTGLIIHDLKGRDFDTGELKTMTLESVRDVAGEALSPIAFLDKGSSNLYFFGAFHYVDERGEEFGNVRLGVFRRRWIPEATSFRRTEGQDHEYSD